jgi:methyl-accepting chemotaxis protein
MSDARPLNRRNLKNLLINPDYQLRYVFWLGITGLSLTAFNASLFYYYVRENYALLVELSPMTDEAKAQLYRELNEIVVKLAGISLLFLAVVAVIGVVYSHRTAGPMYKFKKIFGEIRSGNRGLRIQLRPKDDFKDVAESFNQMMDSLTGPPQAR